jgi:hypothetical protein
VLVCCKGTYSLLRCHLNRLRFRDLYNDRIIHSNIIEINRTIPLLHTQTHNSNNLHEHVVSTCHERHESTLEVKNRDGRITSLFNIIIRYRYRHILLN